MPTKSKTPRKGTARKRTPKPPPVTGQLHLRIAPSLHQRLSEIAAHEGVSLNQLSVALLAGGIGYRFRKRDNSLSLEELLELRDGKADR